MGHPKPTKKSPRKRPSKSPNKVLYIGGTPKTAEEWDQTLHRALEESNRLREILMIAKDDHSATHDDLRECMEKLAEREQLCQDLRNQMISQGMLRDEQRTRIERLEGYIDRVREIDSLTHLGTRPAEDTGGV